MRHTLHTLLTSGSRGGGLAARLVHNAGHEWNGLRLALSRTGDAHGLSVLLGLGRMLVNLAFSVRKSSKPHPKPKRSFLTSDFEEQSTKLREGH
jgi:hypothetical protein